MYYILIVMYLIEQVCDVQLLSASLTYHGHTRRLSRMTSADDAVCRSV